jgi:hypothetical protein
VHAVIRESVVFTELPASTAIRGPRSPASANRERPSKIRLERQRRGAASALHKCALARQITTLLSDPPSALS